MKHLIFIAFNLLIVFSVFSQQNIIQGYVYDEITRQPLPYANISIDDISGTITNEEGFYKYKFFKERKYPIDIKISYIGYESKLISINNSDIHKIYLKPKESIIPEAVVKADFIYALLNKAYNKIPENYPDKGQRYKGFFRQTISRGDKILYMGEAFMDAYKSTYEKNCEDNQIEILKFRKFSNQNKYENNYRFTGGPFLIYRLDMVKLRSPFLNPEYYNKFNYEYNNIVSFQDREFYELLFESKSQKISGKILIDKKDYGYANIKLEDQDTISESGFKKGPLSCNVTYTKIGDLYFLNNYSYSLILINPEKKEELVADLIYTTVESNLYNGSPIDYKRTIALNDVFMNETIDTSNNFWRNLNIIENDSSMNEFIKLHKNLQNQKSKSWVKYLMNFNFGFGVGNRWMNSNLFANSFQATQISGVTETSIVNYDNKHLLYGYFSVGYHISKKSEISYSYAKDRFSDKQYIQRGLSYIYRTRIKNYGKPIFLNTELGISFFNYERKANFQNETPIFLSENLYYIGIKGTDLNIATGLTAFLSNSFAASLKIQLSYMADYTTIFNYEEGLTNIIYKPINEQSVDFKDKLSTSVSIDIKYYLNKF